MNNIDYELIAYNKLKSIVDKAKKEDSTVVKDLEELLEETKTRIDCKENLSIAYLLSSTNILDSKEKIRNLLAYLEKKR